MNDLLLTILVAGLAIVATLSFAVWRIHRLQYPPELRWPTERERKRRHRSSSREHPSGSSHHRSSTRS